MKQLIRESGIPCVGPLPWGAHFCQFYRTKEDLLETLAPYFAAGLRDNEYCLWVTSGLMDRDEAREAISRHVPDFEERSSQGQIEITDYRDWYAGGAFDADRTLEKWVVKEREARERGYDGLRLSGDTVWVHGSGWHDFMDYERRVNEAFGGFRLIGVCTYSVDACSAGDVIDVVRNHGFTLSRRGGEWEVIENASLKVAKEELKKLNAQLEDRVKDRTRELERMVASRDEFLAMLGHELRNPLAPIRNAAHVLRTLNPEQDTARRATEVLDRQVAHMTRLIDDLLDVARITQGRVNLSREPVELAAVLGRAVETVRPLMDARGHRLKIALKHTPTVYADATRLAQVFGNLLDNAAKYTPPNGEVLLTVEEGQGRAAVVRVRDSGVGIPADMLCKVFEPFKQVCNDMGRSEGGLGLGLAVVRRLVQMHGGTVTATSAGEGRGSEFVVRLPVLRAPRSLPRAEASAGKAVPPRRILVIEDNVDGADMTCAMLNVLGHEARTAYDGSTGLALAREFLPEVVLSDIGLPDIDGYELARRLREEPATRDSVLVALTGYGQESDRERARAAGYDAHCLKPASLETLMQCCSRRREAQG